MADIYPFKIAIPESELDDDLKQRLLRTRLPKCPPENVEWDQGVPLTEVERLITYWRDQYDWRKHEAELNLLPHFITAIQCDGFEPLDIHFIHVRSPRPNAIPLLIVHGWPGSFLEATKVLQPLTNPTSPESPAFHVVALSLPHYGFSGGTTRPGFSSTEYATTCHLLMLRLSYTQYATQGGDWGYLITRTMSVLFPQHCLANHTNMDSAPLTALNSLLSADPTTQSPPLTPQELTGLARTTWFTTHGSGYSALQSTKPTRLAFLLSDSPAGLLAYIYENLHERTDAYPWTPETRSAPG